MPAITLRGGIIVPATEPAEVVETMADMTTLAAITGSIKAAADIAKTLRDLDHSLETAELRLRMVDVLSSLADARESVLEPESSVKDKDREIERLQDLFAFKGALAKRKDAYYEMQFKSTKVVELDILGL